MIRYWISIAFCIASNVLVLAQEPVEYGSAEEGFALMRNYATEGDLETAKTIGYSLLKENEAYHDVALYLARVHGWQSQFDSAYQVLDQVIDQDPELFEAYRTCADIAYWDSNWDRWEVCVDRALELEPDSARIFERHKKARQELRFQTNEPEFFGQYSYDHFALPYVRHWHLLSTGAQLPFRYGTLVPYMNVGHLAGNYLPANDIQLNLDAYLTLGKLNQALLAYGFSPNGALNFLPVHRAAAELWQTLPMGFGLSAGFRYFYWDQSFTFFTFSAEKYAGNYWFSLRNYLFDKDYGLSASWYLSARRYFATRFDHLTLILGYGTAPDEPLVLETDLERLSAVSGRLEYSRQLNPRLRMVASAAYAYEEYFDQEYRHRINLGLGCYFRIRK